MTRRARLSRSVKAGGKTRLHKTYHPKFKTQLKHALGKIAETTGHPFEVLEHRFMKEFNKMPLNKRHAVSQGVGVGGFYATMVITGAIFGVPLFGALAGVPVVAGITAKDIASRKAMGKQKREFEEIFED